MSNYLRINAPRKYSIRVSVRACVPYDYPKTKFTNPYSTNRYTVLLLCILLTYSMLQSPSWEANWSAASQEIPRISWNPKVQYRTHKCPPPVPILSQLNPVHTPKSHFLKIHFNIILPSMPGSPQWSPSFRFPHQNPVHAFPLPNTRNMTRPSHSSGFYNLHNIGWGVQIIQLSIT